MKSFVIIGCGRFGMAVGKTLYSLGHEVLAIDSSEEVIQEISDDVTYAVQADITDEKVLRSLGISNFDVAVVAIGSDLEAAVLATLIVKELGVKKVISKAQSEVNARILYKIGADRVVLPEKDMGLRLAHNLASTNILDFIELSPEYSVIEVAAIEDWYDKTLEEISIPSKYSVNVIAIKKDKEIKVSPTKNDIVEKNDILVIVGNVGDVARLEAEMADDK